MIDFRAFRAEIARSGTIKNSRFMATINYPDYMKTSSSVGGDVSVEASRSLALRCISAQIPGVSVASIDGPPRYGYGPVETNPYSMIHGDSVLTFLLDGQAKVHRFFYQWTNVIVNHKSFGMFDMSEKTGLKPNWMPYEVGFKDQYSTTISITAYNDDNQEVFKANLYNAFPKTLPQFDMAWENTNDLIKLPVEFAYTDFDVEYAKLPSILSGDVANTIRDNPEIF